MLPFLNCHCKSVLAAWSWFQTRALINWWKKISFEQTQFLTKEQQYQVCIYREATEINKHPYNMKEEREDPYSAI